METPQPEPTQRTSNKMRDKLEYFKTNGKYSLDSLTVLSVQNDPYRLDTPANHRLGQWFADTLSSLGLQGRQIHCRGAHYAFIGQPKPDGKPYTNTDADWTWLASKVLKAARWLDYVPFTQITDQRNTPPEVTMWEQPDPWLHLKVGIDLEIPDADDIHPTIGLEEFTGTQQYKLVVFGEKSSLAPILGGLCRRYKADLYLPTGEISDTLMHQMADVGNRDGRPMVVLTFSDADPAGWQMPISIARKLQAFQTTLFPDLEFQVHRVAVTPDQVRQYGLPSTPLKETEKRGDRWRDQMGLEQTEIDALVTLQPQTFTAIATNAFDQFFDSTLVQRCWTAEAEWLRAAQQVVDASTSDADRSQYEQEAAELVELMRAGIDQLNNKLQIDTNKLKLPPIRIPAAVDKDNEALPLAVIDSRWSFPDQCQHLIEAKQYVGDE